MTDYNKSRENDSMVEFEHNCFRFKNQPLRDTLREEYIQTLPEDKQFAIWLHKTLCNRLKTIDLSYYINKCSLYASEHCTLHACGIRSEKCPQCMARKAVDELKKMLDYGEETCEWLEDTYGRWHTGCNKLGDNNPLEYKFCPYCGKILRVKVLTGEHGK